MGEDLQQKVNTLAAFDLEVSSPQAYITERSDFARDVFFNTDSCALTDNINTLILTLHVRKSTAVASTDLLLILLLVPGIE